MMPFRPVFCIANIDLYQVPAKNAASLSELAIMPRPYQYVLQEDTLIDWNNSFAASHDRRHSERAQPIWHCRNTSALSCVFLFRTFQIGRASCRARV